MHPTPTPVVRHGYSLAFDLYDLCVARISGSLETRCCYMVQEKDFTGSFQHLTPCNNKVMRLVRSSSKTKELKDEGDGKDIKYPDIHRQAFVRFV